MQIKKWGLAMIVYENLKLFKKESFAKLKPLFEKLAIDGQKPHTLFITCSDSRVNPNLVTHTKPGEIFVIRNIGNIVPNWHTKIGEHSTISAIEYAVLNLNVKHIIVCGHTHCGACDAIWNRANLGFHTSQWIKLGDPVMRFVKLFKLDEKEDIEYRAFLTEQVNVVLQLKRLSKYPFIKDRLKTGEISLSGWHYIIKTGDVLIFDKEKKEFILPNMGNVNEA